ncbi:MAG: ABC transporter permease [Bryobacterales bacterium]|nr:ABC transporter permease [Bryobacterales bacterium]
MSRHDRLYRKLLHILPAHFRESYEDEMTRAFAEVRRRDGASGTWLHTIPDLAFSAIQTHGQALREDLRYAARKIAQSPGMLLLVALTFGAGIGTNIALFSMVDALLFRPLAVAEADTLVSIQRGPGTREPTSYFDYRDLRDRNVTFSQLAATFTFPALVSASTEHRRMCSLVTGNYFVTAGVLPLLGRGIGKEDDETNAAVAVLSHALWQSEFQSDPRVLGRTVLLNDRKFTIVGVTGPEFTGTHQPMLTEIYVPLSMHSVFIPGVRETEATRDQRWLVPFGRLKAGVSAAQAEANLNAIEAQIQSEHPELGDSEEKRIDRALHVTPTGGVRVPHLRQAIRRGATFMMAVTFLLVLLASVNVTGILLARASARTREIALRLSLGASRRRILRELLAESALFGLAGAVAGLVIAYVSIDALNHLQAPMQGAWRIVFDARIDHRVLTYTLGVALLSSLLFGLTPALRAMRIDPNEILKEGTAGSQGSRSGNRMRRGIVVAQFTLSVALLAILGLFLRSLNNLYRADPGFETARQSFVYLVQTNEASTFPRFYGELKRNAEALPGVLSVSLSTNPPVRLGNYSRQRVESATGQSLDAQTVFADGDHFVTNGIALLRGSTFPGNETRPVVIVNQALARALWPGGDAIGQRLRIGGRADHEVIGVAADSKYASLAEDPQPFFYQPLDASRSGNRIGVTVRTAVAPASITPRLANIVRRLDPTVDVNRSGTYAEAIDQAIWPTRMAARNLAGFSALGLILAISGLFGLMAHFAEQRRHEAGLRIALGATQWQILRLFLMRGISLAAWGIGTGTALSLLAARAVKGFLSGVSPTDPATYAGVAATLLAVALLAAWIPARRAARIDPIATLRHQ